MSSAAWRPGRARVGDVSFTAGEVALIAALLGAVTTPLLWIFRLLLAEKDRQIVRLEDQNEMLMTAVLSGTRAVESATTVLKQRTVRP